MAWDPTQPPTNGSLLSAPIRGNFAALAPLMQGPGGTPFPLLAPDGTEAAPVYSFASQPGTGFWRGGSGGITMVGAGANLLHLGYNVDLVGLALRPDGVIGWSAAGSPIGVTDLKLVRDAAGLLALKNGANRQMFRVYEDAGTGKYLALETYAGYGFLHEVGPGELYVGTDTGSVYIQPAGGAVGNWKFHTSGIFIPSDDNVKDIGFAPGARIRSLYAGTSVNTPRIDLPTGAAPATPPAGTVSVYAKTDKKAYQKDDAGVETPLGGGGTPAMVPLWLENARFPDGTTGNLFPLPVERVSTGTPPANCPKFVELVYQFDQSAVETLIWKGVTPLDYVAAGAITLVVKFSMFAATTGNVRLLASWQALVDGAIDARATTGLSSISADTAVPTTLGYQKEIRLSLTATGAGPGQKFLVALGLISGSASNATGDRVLESAHLEFARA